MYWAVWCGCRFPNVLLKRYTVDVNLICAGSRERTILDESKFNPTHYIHHQSRQAIKYIFVTPALANVLTSAINLIGVKIHVTGLYYQVPGAYLAFGLVPSTVEQPR